mmetsp:Transcript_2897/g.8325  ORF Transcript_2897/g.8325 Transcript_2897/m.8325 type:complete len:427 (+) Transcript_2897:1525-2805(+)
MFEAPVELSTSMRTTSSSMRCEVRRSSCETAASDDAAASRTAMKFWRNASAWPATRSMRSSARKRHCSTAVRRAALSWALASMPARYASRRSSACCRESAASLSRSMADATSCFTCFSSLSSLRTAPSARCAIASARPTRLTPLRGWGTPAIDRDTCASWANTSSSSAASLPHMGATSPATFRSKSLWRACADASRASRHSLLAPHATCSNRSANSETEASECSVRFCNLCISSMRPACKFRISAHKPSCTSCSSEDTPSAISLIPAKARSATPLHSEAACSLVLPISEATSSRKAASSRLQERAPSSTSAFRCARCSFLSSANCPSMAANAWTATSSACLEMLCLSVSEAALTSRSRSACIDDRSAATRSSSPSNCFCCAPTAARKSEIPEPRNEALDTKAVDANPLGDDPNRRALHRVRSGVAN